jgi:hypothetical protein
MSFLGELVGIAAPIVGGIFGGPIGAGLGGAFGSLVNGGGIQGALTGGLESFAGSEIFSGINNAFGGGAGSTGGLNAGVGSSVSTGDLTPAAIDSLAGTPGYGPNASASDFSAGIGGSGISGGGGAGLSVMQQLSSLLQRASSVGSGSQGGGLFSGLLGGGGAGGGGNQNIFKALAGLYALTQSQSLQKQAQLPSASSVEGLPGFQAGQDAVARSMASQGYAGSSNMAGALASQAGNFYNQAVGQRQSSVSGQLAPLMGQLSGMGLLSSAFGG